MPMTMTNTTPTDRIPKTGSGNAHNPLVRFLDIMFQDAHKREVEEIHVVTSPDSLTVKYMIDGEIK